MRFLDKNVLREYIKWVVYICTAIFLFCVLILSVGWTFDVVDRLFVNSGDVESSAECSCPIVE